VTDLWACNDMKASKIQVQTTQYLIAAVVIPLTHSQFTAFLFKSTLAILIFLDVIRMDHLAACRLHVLCLDSLLLGL